MAQLILREDVDDACFLNLNRPDVLNALNVELFTELRGHVTDLASSSNAVRCVVLRGSGRAFSAGHDLGDIRRGEVLPHELKHSPGACEDMAERLSAFGKRSKGEKRGP